MPAGFCEMRGGWCIFSPPVRYDGMSGGGGEVKVEVEVERERWRER